MSDPISSSRKRPRQPSKRERGRPKVSSDSEQSDAIGEVAWRLFIENGYSGTTMSDVASAARVSLKTVYRLFPAKRELFTAVVELHRRSMLALPADYDDCSIEEALGHIFQIDIDPEADRVRTALMTLFIVEAGRFPELGPLVREYGGDRAMKLLSEWLDRQAQSGRASVPDSEVAAKMLMDVAFGAISLKVGDQPQWPGGGNRRAYLKRCFSLIAAGLTPRVS
ncbi:TetR/AcrR family transcriptional regulator [Agrobacterium rubi]|uniref:TetR/AcrR family transcriptional regulator n=1 Tax=Agrobacterium rubi TaxID=28099 RepID=UPI001573BA75|nr:TetR/AcrR family transcriptional regulator [Agrobacterium rubi]NTF10528.1 TetR/AcrR family transcriptional regulator [Agrobacterium rubi]NTF22922.1 TetR/AcrR family transcriptional regulator [Agrobacterium rubi]NTF29853.1 TetR/AcrR family transcriptional regulator [Agrobacterium rubi]